MPRHAAGTTSHARCRARVLEVNEAHGLIIAVSIIQPVTSLLRCHVSDLGPALLEARARALARR